LIRIVKLYKQTQITNKVTDYDDEFAKLVALKEQQKKSAGEAEEEEND
jgi:hypothetical protein